MYGKIVFVSCDVILWIIFLTLIQLFVFPLIVKCLGYRWTFRLGLILHVVVCVVLPFSNQITGPIPEMSVLNATLSSSGSGSGVGYQNITSYDYCGNDLSAEVAVNKNSVKRIPIKVWIVVAIILSVMVLSRYVLYFPCTLLYTITCNHMSLPTCTQNDKFCCSCSFCWKFNSGKSIIQNSISVLHYQDHISMWNGKKKNLHTH